MKTDKRQGYIPTLDDEALLVYLDVLKVGFGTRPELISGFTQNTEFTEQLTRIMFYGFLKKENDLFGKEA